MPTEKTFHVARYVEQAASAAGLTLDPAYVPGVVENMARIHALAGSFLDFSPPDEEEPGFVFVPSEP
ncbi:MAG TPA: DUF4089 domain-containing protein [Candidatus Sulfotelmatobacter sp.]|nr:DUF4089 domain-containing protein [Candidatus Sulfotelmatobacter sp.]